MNTTLSRPVVVPANEPGDHRTGTIEGLSQAALTDIIGFPPNVADDTDKVTASWGFTVDGQRCGVWDYKGSGFYGSWSTFGPAEALKKLFGSHYVEG